MPCCKTCGAEFEPSHGPGRPRIRCTSCSPPQKSPVRVESCARCDVAFSARSNQKYCSRTCRDKDAWDRQKASNPCPGCGGPMSRSSRSSADSPICRKCLVGGREHGTEVMYRKGGCRCADCKRAVARRQREYAARRKAEGRSMRQTRRDKCAECGIDFLSQKREYGFTRYCGVDCAKLAQGWTGEPRDRFRPSAALRKAIADRDSGLCQLCKSPTRPDADSAHPRYPTLDHIVPRSFGGSDDESNLRLACRQCNTRRGTNVDWLPEVTADEYTLTG